jgi:hypothetical protein
MMTRVGDDAAPEALLRALLAGRMRAAWRRRERDLAMVMAAGAAVGWLLAILAGRI